MIAAILALATVASTGNIGFNDMERFVKVYGAPKTVEEFYLPQDKAGVTGLLEQPMIISYKSADKEELVSIFLQEGLKSIYQFEEFAFLQKFLMGGRDKAFLYRSAARYLGVAELALPVHIFEAPGQKENLYVKYADSVPSVLVLDESRLLDSKNTDKLVEIGQFAFQFDSAKITQDLMNERGPMVRQGRGIVNWFSDWDAGKGDGSDGSVEA